MAIGGMLQNLGRSITGSNVKAVLCIRKPSKSGITKDGAGIDAVTSESSAISDVNKINTALMKSAENSLKKGLAGGTYSKIRSLAETNNYIALEVQYNPTSMTMDSTAGRQMNYGGKVGNMELQQFTAPASTTLSFDLLFDDTNTMDAFMLSDNPITGATVSNLKNFGMSLFGPGYSVKRQMEGLISMLTVPAARHVIFFWGNMTFRGEVTEIGQKYTMFNKKGAPIRGTVTLHIRQGDGSDQAKGAEKAYKYDETYWEHAFDETFKEPSMLGGAMDKVGKAMNNSILNLKL